MDEFVVNVDPVNPYNIQDQILRFEHVISFRK